MDFVFFDGGVVVDGVVVVVDLGTAEDFAEVFHPTMFLNIPTGGDGGVVLVDDADFPNDGAASLSVGMPFMVPVLLLSNVKIRDVVLLVLGVPKSSGNDDLEEAAAVAPPRRDVEGVAEDLTPRIQAKPRRLLPPPRLLLAVVVVVLLLLLLLLLTLLLSSFGRSSADNDFLSTTIGLFNFSSAMECYTLPKRIDQLISSRWWTKVES